MNKKKIFKKTFSSANLFFLCISFIFMFSYYYNTWQSSCAINLSAANSIFLIMSLATLWYLPLRFPLFVKVKLNKEKLDESFYEKIYFKKINLGAQIYQGFFQWTKSSDLISFFNNKGIKLGIKNRECDFIYDNSEVKGSHRIYDFIFTIITGIIIFFVAQEFSKIGIIFGLTMATFAILLVFRNTILNRIFSVNIESNNEYNLAVIIPYNYFDELIFNKYGFAYYKDNTILVNKDVFCGGEVLKKYIIAHEIGHLKTSNRIKNFFLLTIFILATYLFFIGLGLVVQLGIDNIISVFIPLIIYTAFLSFYIPFIRKKNEKDEYLADIYAIKKIGKTAVIDGLELIKKDNLYGKSKLRMSGILIDRRIKFVKEYEC